MDKRQNLERTRADGSGKFSPRSYATPPRSYPRNTKAHGACTFAILVLAVPLAALADDTGSTTTVVLDVAKSGSLGALVTAVIWWLTNQRKSKAADATMPLTPPERNPPLGEDVARTYVSKNDMEVCQGRCRNDIESLRSKIDANDHSAEERSISTHRRIDQVFVSQQKTNKALGMMVGIMVGKGVAPAAMATMTISEES